MAEENESKILATFSCAPVQNYGIGPYQFEKTLLRFEAGQEEELEKFKALVESLPAAERARIVYIDVEAAESQLAAIRAASGGATRAIDSTVGERVSKPKAEGNLGNPAAEATDQTNQTTGDAPKPTGLGGIKIGG